MRLTSILRVGGPEFVSKIKHIIETSTGFEKHMEKVNIIDGGDGKCLAEFTIGSEHVNRFGGLHGGFTATLVDMLTTYALMSKDCSPGLSVDLQVSYMKAAREGDVVIANAATLRVGKRLAFIECDLRLKKDNSIIAKGSHTKFVDI